MDDLTLLRELRADAPAPPRARLGAGRDRLLREAARGGRPRGRRPGRPRADWRLAAVGAAAAIAAASVIGSQVFGTGDDGAASPGGRPPYTYELGSAKDILVEAAGAVADDPVPSVHANEWTYQKLLRIYAQEDGPGEEKGGPRVVEHWAKYVDPLFENGRSGDDRSPRETFTFLAQLPEAPEQVKKKVDAFFVEDKGAEPGDAHDYAGLSSLVSRATVIEPTGLATVYRTMATIPGLRAVETRDAAGREAIGIYLPGQARSGMPNLLLLDPRTYHFSGWGTMRRGGGIWKSVQAVNNEAVLETAVVDKEGERP
ncbi:CU044_5270 family protein [Streptomyces sp. NPDC001530]|uniref:CU044_5270 family protein n=1 Tax=Streptomyces sp. NPDC001530 TaxID=3364582 RepID=UPI0036AC4E06